MTSPFSYLFFCAYIPHTVNESSPIGSGFSFLLIHPLTAACTSCFCYIMTQSACCTLHKSSSVTWTHFSQHLLITSLNIYISCQGQLLAALSTVHHSLQLIFELPSLLLKCRLNQRSWSLTLLIISWWGGKNGTYKWNETGNTDRIFGWCMDYLMECTSTAVGM